MTTKSIRFDTYDSVADWAPVRRATRDSRLDAFSSGKLFVTDTTWQGDLAPRVDSTMSAIEPLTTPFAVGRILHAEPAPADLNLGLAWLGDITTAIDHAVRSSRGPVTSGELVDITEVVQPIEEMRRAMGSTDPKMRATVGDAIRRVRAAMDAIGARRPTGDAAKSWGADYLARSRASTRASIESIQQAQAVRATGDSIGTVRDLQFAAGRATTMPEKIDALNRVAAAFWADRECRHR